MTPPILPLIAKHFRAADAEFRDGMLWLLDCHCPNTGFTAGWSPSLYTEEFAIQMAAKLLP